MSAELWTNFEFSLLMSALLWVLSRYWYSVVARGSRRKVTGSEKLGILVLSIASFPALLVWGEWSDLQGLAGASVLRWFLVASPLVALYYGLFRFWAWRRARLTAAGHCERVHYILKPTSAVGWVVYIYAGLFFLWQLVHWLAPSIMPGWIR